MTASQTNHERHEAQKQKRAAARLRENCACFSLWFISCNLFLIGGEFKWSMLKD